MYLFQGYIIISGIWKKKEEQNNFFFGIFSQL